MESYTTLLLVSRPERRIESEKKSPCSSKDEQECSKLTDAGSSPARGAVTKGHKVFKVCNVLRQAAVGERHTRLA